MSENRNDITAQVETTSARAEWQRPALRKLDARDAELTGLNLTDNAVFS
ncbi:MAG: hypothetical protein WDM91_21750 [Rhizomicrobium sp.]